MLAFEPIIVELEGAPIGKARPRTRFGQARPYADAKTENYEHALGFAARAVMGSRLPFECALSIIVRAGVPVPASWAPKKRDRALAGLHRPTGRPDADNYLKAACDALNKIVFRDDAQIVEATITKSYVAQPLLRIEVRPA